MWGTKLHSFKLTKHLKPWGYQILRKRIFETDGIHISQISLAGTCMTPTWQLKGLKHSHLNWPFPKKTPINSSSTNPTDGQLLAAFAKSLFFHSGKQYNNIMGTPTRPSRVRESVKILLDVELVPWAGRGGPLQGVTTDKKCPGTRWGPLNLHWIPWRQRGEPGHYCPSSPGERSPHDRRAHIVNSWGQISHRYPQTDITQKCKLWSRFKCKHFFLSKEQYW